MKQAIAIFYGFALFILMPLDVGAGWFGPDNYEDCVLEKMKDQPRNMMPYARDACEKKFPYEKPLTPHDGSPRSPEFSRLLMLNDGENYYLDSDLKITWCDTSSSSISICVSKNETDYRITRAIMAFSTKKCEVVELEDLELKDLKLKGIIKGKLGAIEKAKLEAIEKAKPEDFREKVTFTFSRWRDKSTADVKDAARFKCMRQVEIYGERAK